MTRVRPFVALASTIAVAVMASGASAQSGEAIKWRADTIMAATHPLQRDVLEGWSTEVSKRTQNKLQITWHHAGQLGLGPANALRVLQARTVEVVGFVYSASAGDMPLLSFPSLPMLHSERGPESVAEMWRKTRPIWERELAKFGVIPVLFGMADEQIVYNSKRPINKLEDLRGLKLRFYSREQAQFLQRLGVSPTSVPYNDMVSAAQRGVIDGVITGGNTGVAFRLWDARQKYAVVELGLDYVPFFLGVSQKAWDELPKETQEVARKVGAEYESKVVDAMKSVQRNSWKTLQGNGVSITRLPSADIAKAREHGREIMRAWVDKAGPAGKELVEAMQSR